MPIVITIIRLIGIPMALIGVEVEVGVFLKINLKFHLELVGFKELSYICLVQDRSLFRIYQFLFHCFHFSMPHCNLEQFLLSHFCF